MNSQNPFSNIGTPNFNLSQIPQYILQSLTPMQLRMIQQRHRQLLLQQQSQQSQSTPHQQAQNASRVVSQGKNSPYMKGKMGAAEPNFANSPSQANAVQNAQLLKTQQQQLALLQQRQQQEQSQGLLQQPVQPVQKQQVTGVPSMNLPPQIAQLPSHLQLQWLRNLKQQAIAKKNSNAVTMITQLQQQIQNTIQQQGKIPQPQGLIQNQYQQDLTSNVSQKPPSMSPARIETQNPMLPMQQVFHQGLQAPSSQSSMIQQNRMQQQGSYTTRTPLGAQNTQGSEIELSEFQPICKNPKESVLSTPDAWSRSLRAQNIEPNTDLLLYEQIIFRDQLNSLQLIKERNGYEPMSKFGFSNKEYLTRLLQDLNYYKDLKDTRMKSITNTSQGMCSKSIWGDGYSGYGNGITNKPTNITVGGENNGHYLPLNVVYDSIMQHETEELVPIRLEFENERDGFSLRDTFVWNINQKLVQLEEFVSGMLCDYRFAQPALYKEVVINSIKEQLKDFQPHPFRQSEKTSHIGGNDIRIKIVLDIVVGQNELFDAIEWDISNPENNPEEFAQTMCEELQLPGEFVTAIAHSIREQKQIYHKALALVGYKFNGSFVEDDEICSHLLPVITFDELYRSNDEIKSYTPNLTHISMLELELDKDKDRDTRRKRRQVRFNRRGVNAIADPSMPDLSDIPKTFRIPVPSTVLPGGIDLGPPVGSYSFVTSTSQALHSFTPEPVEPPCRIITHERGKYLLIRIKIPSTQKDNPSLSNPQPAQKIPFSVSYPVPLTADIQSEHITQHTKLEDHNTQS